MAMDCFEPLSPDAHNLQVKEKNQLCKNLLCQKQQVILWISFLSCPSFDRTVSWKWGLLRL